jgi:hypothetical protein
MNPRKTITAQNTTIAAAYQMWVESTDALKNAQMRMGRIADRTPFGAKPLARDVAEYDRADREWRGVVAVRAQIRVVYPQITNFKF